MLYCFPRSSIKFQGHTVQNITDFDPNWAFTDYRPVAAFKSLRFALFLAATKQLYKWCFPSVRPSVRLSVKKLPYMKKTRKKKQVCGAACFMAAEIKFSEDVRLSVCLSHLFDYVPIIVSSWNFLDLLLMTKVRSMQKVKVRGQRSRSQRSQPNLTVSGL